VKKRNYWILFGSVQTVGIITPLLTGNVHNNPFPIVIGLVLLLPGSIAVLVLGWLPEFAKYVVLPLILPINATVWYSLRRIRRGNSS
jgi:hypothetical protein